MNSPPSSGRKNKRMSFDLSHSIISNKIMFVICSIIVIALIADASLARTSDLFSANLSYKPNMLVVFTLISLAYFVGQFMILRFVRYRSKEIQARPRSQFYRTYKVTMAVQIALGIILLFVILQLFTMSYYLIVTLIAATTISYSLAMAMMVLLTKNFLSWFRTNKNFVILAYGISAAAISIHLGFALFFADAALLDVPAEARTAISRVPFFIPGSIKFVLDNIHSLTSIVSFIVLWGATAMLLHHYSHKVGRIKYWIVISLPLVYFLSQFPTLFLKVFDPVIMENPFFYGSLLTFVFTLSKSAGGILFGIAFWTMARNIPHTIISDYLLISALGFFLLFSSDQAIVLISVPYPPFGLAAVSFMGLSAYLIFIGIYYSAMSLSHDDRVRREIKKFAMQESKLLDSIGSAQVEKDIIEKVTVITQIQDAASQKSGVPASIDENDIRNYLEDVLNEMKAVRRDHKDDKG